MVGNCYLEDVMFGETVDWDEDNADLFTLGQKEISRGKLNMEFMVTELCKVVKLMVEKHHSLENTTQSPFLLA